MPGGLGRSKVWVWFLEDVVKVSGAVAVFGAVAASGASFDSRN